MKPFIKKHLKIVSVLLLFNISAAFLYEPHLNTIPHSFIVAAALAGIGGWIFGGLIKQ